MNYFQAPNDPNPSRDHERDQAMKELYRRHCRTTFWTICLISVPVILIGLFV